jgi:hypothetical protein
MLQEILDTRLMVIVFIVRIFIIIIHWCIFHAFTIYTGWWAKTWSIHTMFSHYDFWPIFNLFLIPSSTLPNILALHCPIGIF